MDQMEAIQNAVKILLEKAQNGSVSDLASAVEKATDALKLSTDLEKSQAELKKIALEESKLTYEIGAASKHERSEALKEYVSLLAPIVTVITLAPTLIVQGWQFSQSEKDKREAAEDAQWADAVKTISNDGKLSPTVIALNPFLKSPRHGDDARAYAVQVLANTSDKSLFTDLFGAAFVPVGWNNFEHLLKLDRALHTRVGPLDRKSYDPATSTNDFTKLTPEEKQTEEYGGDALKKICSQIASVLGTPRPRGVNLDLSATYLYNCDMGGVDLSAADISQASLIHVDIKGAKLADVNHFDGVYFFKVAWWEAENISPALLEFLEENADSKYKEDFKYGPKYRTFTPDQYEAEVRRLKRRP